MKWRRIPIKKAINSEKDPYSGKDFYADMTRCKDCRSVYHNKRWVLEKDVPRHLAAKIVEGSAACPSCRKRREKYPEGFLTLQGDYLKEHKEEILRMIRNKESQEAWINPLGRIIEINDRADRVEITTTTEKLAQRIGRILKKSFHGEVEYKWSEDVKIARVVWMR